MYRHILIPTDGSELAEHGVAHGLALAPRDFASASPCATPCSASSDPSVGMRICRYMLHLSIVWTCSLPSECKLGPRFGYILEINQSTAQHAAAEMSAIGSKTGPS